MSAGSFVVDVVAAAVKKIRNRPKAVARRKARVEQRAASDAAGGEFFNEEEQPMNLNLIIALLGSLLRHALPAATSFLAGYGVSVGGDTNPYVTIVVAIAVYLLMQGISFVRQWQKNRA